MRWHTTGTPARMCNPASGQRLSPVVVGGGIRKHDPALELFERVIQRVRQHAPGAAIAFNTTPMDCVEAALRWLR